MNNVIIVLRICFHVYGSTNTLTIMGLNILTLDIGMTHEELVPFEKQMFTSNDKVI